MIRRFVMIAAVFALSHASPAFAQSSPVCTNGMWNLLKDEDVQKLGLAERVEIFSDAARMSADGSHMIKILVADCPVYGYEIRAIRLPMMPRADGTIGQGYGLYVSVGYLRKGDTSDLMHRAWQQGCVVNNGGADFSQRPAEDPDTPAIRTCIHDRAVAAHDIEYARWLERTLGTDLHPKQDALNDPEKMIQDRIDQLKALPQAPSGAINALEKLKRSFHDFPPMH